jgi:uncharacterized protein (TIGR00369 family)
MMASGSSAPKMTAEEFETLAAEGVPYVGLTVRLPYRDLLSRPGGTICGPALMALADITLYGLVLSMVGRVELAVTTDLNVHFLTRPPPADVIAEGRILRLGRRLAVGEVIMHNDAGRRPICHAIGTYAIPPPAP